MNVRTTTLGTSPVRDLEGHHFEPRGTPTSSKLLAAAIGAVILLAVLV